MQLLIEQLNFNEHDVFLDLGSGIGHLVLYVAGGTKVSAFSETFGGFRQNFRNKNGEEGREKIYNDIYGFPSSKQSQTFSEF